MSPHGTAHPSSALERFAAAARSHGFKVPAGRTAFRMRCPGHHGDGDNLAVAMGDRGVLLTCHSHGCEATTIARALGMNADELFDTPARPASGQQWRAVAVYSYQDEAGATLFEVVREERGERLPGKKPEKRFRQRHATGGGRLVWGLNGTRRVLFRLPQLLEAIAEERPVFIVEGEKCVLAAERLGVIATTAPMGAGNWVKEGRDPHGFSEALQGAHVVLNPDADDKGRRHMLDVGELLSTVCASVRVLELPNLPAKGDLADWEEAGGDATRLAELLEAAVPFSQWRRSLGERPAELPEGDAETAPSAPATSEIDLATFADLIAGPRHVPFLVDHLIQERALHQLYGPSGVGKTFFALALAHAIASGRPFLGRQTQQAPVLYILGEGQAGFAQRALAWCEHEGVDSPGDAIRYVRHPVPPDSEASIEALLAAVRARFTERLGLVVIDTLSANASRGFDESATKEMGLLLNGVRRLMRETECAVLIVHHTGWQEGRERGSSSLRAACEVVVSLEKTGRHRVKVLVPKARDFDTPDPLAVELVPAAGSLAVALSSRASALSDAQQRLLQALQDSPTALRSNEWLARSGVGRSTFFELKGRLVTDGLVATNERGAFYPTPAGLLALQDTKESSGPPVDSGQTGSGARDRGPSGSVFVHSRTPDLGLAALDSANISQRGAHL